MFLIRCACSLNVSEAAINPWAIGVFATPSAISVKASLNEAGACDRLA